LAAVIPPTPSLTSVIARSPFAAAFRRSLRVGLLAALCLLAGLFVLVLSPAAATAQSGGSGGQAAQAQAEDAAQQAPQPLKLEEILAETEQAAEEIGSGLLSDDRLTHWRQRLPQLRQRAAAIEAEAQADVNSAQRLLDALGPPPEDGREPRPVAMERDRLQSQLDERKARLKQAQLAIARADELLNQVQAASRERFADELLVRGPSPLAPQTWVRAGEQLTGSLSRLVSVVATSEQLKRDRADWLNIAGGALAIVLVGLAIALLLRRALLQRFGRTPQAEPPPTLTRLTGALLHTLFYLLVPGLAMSALYGYLEAVGLMEGLIDQLALNTALAVAFAFLIDGLARAVTAPEATAWRVLPVSDPCAVRLARIARVGALVFGADILIVRMGRVLQAGDAIAVVHHLLFGITVSVLLLALTRRDIWQPPEFDQNTDEASQTARRKGRTWMTVAVLALTASVLGSVLLGYYELSRYLITRTILTAVLIGLLLLLHAVAREGISAIFEMTRLRTTGRRQQDSTTPILQFWIGAGVDVLVTALGVLLALPLWGVEWTDLWALLLGALMGFKVGGVTISPIDLALAIAIFVVVLSVTRVIQRALDTRVLPQTRLDIGVRESLRTFTGYVGLILAGLVALSVAGLNLSNLAIVAGALSVGIGFGLQAIVNNFVSGLILLFERPIKVGDWVVIGAHQGYVKRIRVRSTEIETFDQSSVIVPNSDFISQSIINWTHTNRVCRVIVPVHVAHGTDTQQVNDLLLQVAREHPQVLRMPEAHVLFMDFGESALHFELRVFARDTDYFLSLASELRFAIDQKFREANIVIPYPQRDLHIRTGTMDRGRARAARPETEIPEAGSTPPTGGPDGD
jgi:small-conductance mechanosensitive channel